MMDITSNLSYFLNLILMHLYVKYLTIFFQVSNNNYIWQVTLIEESVH